MLGSIVERVEHRDEEKRCARNALLIFSLRASTWSLVIEGWRETARATILRAITSLTWEMGQGESERSPGRFRRCCSISTIVSRNDPGLRHPRFPTTLLRNDDDPGTILACEPSLSLSLPLPFCLALSLTEQMAWPKYPVLLRITASGENSYGLGLRSVDNSTNREWARGPWKLPRKTATILRRIAPRRRA